MTRSRPARALTGGPGQGNRGGSRVGGESVSKPSECKHSNPAGCSGSLSQWRCLIPAWRMRKVIESTDKWLPDYGTQSDPYT